MDVVDTDLYLYSQQLLEIIEAVHLIGDKKVVPDIGDNGYVIGKYERLNCDRCSVNNEEDGDLKRWGAVTTVRNNLTDRFGISFLQCNIFSGQSTK